VAVVATILGALLHESLAVTDCSPNPCVQYRDYGWPWEWKTNTPSWLIEETEMDRGVFGFNEEGYSFGILLFTATMWFVVALIMEGVLALIGWGAWRFLVVLKSFSPA